MSDIGHLKCSCQKCGGHIEFPTDGDGEMVACPHCGEQTKLASTSSNPRKNYAVIAGSIVALVVLAVGSGMSYLSKMRKPDASVPTQATSAVTNAAAQNKFVEMDDFKVGAITLKKTEGSALVYAVGTVKNDTARQRFGVKIGLDMLDADDNKIGSASDYIGILEPNKEWQFKALLADPKTVKVKLIKIEEQK